MPKSNIQVLTSLPRVDVLLGVLLCLMIAGQFFLNTNTHRLCLYLSFPVGMFFIYSGGRVYLRILAELFLFKLVVVFLFWAVLSIGWSAYDDIGIIWDKAKIAPFVLLSFVVYVAYIAKYPAAWALFMNIYVMSAVLTGVALLVVNFDSVFLTYVHGIAEEGGRPWRLDGFGRAKNSNLAGVLFGIAAIAVVIGRFHAVFARFDKTGIRIVIAVFLMFILFLTLSRGAMLALIAASGLFVLFRAYHLPSYRKYALWIPVTGCLFLALLAFFVPSVLMYLIERGATGRLDIWWVAWRNFLSSPFFGAGIATQFKYDFLFYGAPTQVNHAHSVYLSTLLHLGVIGLLILFVLMSLALRGAVRYGLSENDFLPLVALLFGVVFGVFDYAGFYVSLGTEWMVFWFPIMVVVASEVRRKRGGLL